MDDHERFIGGVPHEQGHNTLDTFAGGVAREFFLGGTLTGVKAKVYGQPPYNDMKLGRNVCKWSTNPISL